MLTGLDVPATPAFVDAIDQDPVGSEIAEALALMAGFARCGKMPQSCLIYVAILQGAEVQIKKIEIALVVMDGRTSWKSILDTIQREISILHDIATMPTFLGIQ